NLYVTVNAPDDKPTVTINTSGSSSSNNPQSSNFDISVTANDDKGLKGLAYIVKTSSGEATDISGTKTLSGTSMTTSFTVDLSSLA
ncbi:hypothetical protein, partial [Desulfobacter latus]